ncbi:hypothetical protein M9458_026449, partial [Cirrhinus mrigala]
MAEVAKEEVDGENEVNDPPERDEDATKGLNNGEKQMEITQRKFESDQQKEPYVIEKQKLKFSITTTALS